MSLLRRTQAPLSEQAWQAVDEAVGQVLRARLRARAVVDVEGPLGLDTAAVGLGRLDVGDHARTDKVGWGVHRVQPLVETRVDFELDLWEMDNVERGARDLDLGPAEAAARRIADFEDGAVFGGFAPGAITGLTQLTEHEPVPLILTPDGFLECVAKALLALQDAAVDGPYALVLGPDAYRLYATHASGYPLRKQVASLVAGPVHYAPTLKGALLVSQRGGDCVLTLGQDLAVGFENRTTEKVKLFLTESFTFRVIEPAGCVSLPPVKTGKGSKRGR